MFIVTEYAALNPFYTYVTLYIFSSKMEIKTKLFLYILLYTYLVHIKFSMFECNELVEN